jgi:AcrR family transcriptional regulator
MPARKRIDLPRVIQVAVEIANEQGFETVTLASVAARLEIRIPSLYNYVEGLPGLRDAMTLWAARELLDKMRRAAVGKAGDEAVLSLAAGYRAFAHAQPGMYATTQRAPSPEQTELAAVAAELVEILVAVLHPYGFQGDDALHAVRALRSVIHGFIDLEIGGGFGLPLDQDETFNRLMHIFIRGLPDLHTT